MMHKPKKRRIGAEKPLGSNAFLTTRGELKRLSILVAGLSTICSFKILQYLPTFGTSGAFPLGWSNRPRNRHLHPPLRSPGDCNVVRVVPLLLSNLLLYLETHFQ